MLRHLLFDRVTLGDHAGRLASDLLIDVFDLVVHADDFNHADHLFLEGLGLVYILLDFAGLLNHDHSLLVLLLLLHDDLNLLLFVAAGNSLFYFDRFCLVSDLLLSADGLLEHHTFDSGFVGAEHLLLALNDSHLPPGLLSGAVFVLGVHVAVLMAMHGILERALLAALAAGARGAASAGRGLAPESTLLVLVATATAAPSRAATALAGARTGLLLDQTAVARFVLGAVGHTEAGAVSRPLGPPNAVMAANTAEQWITHIEVIRGKIKVAHIDVPFGERARNNG